MRKGLAIFLCLAAIFIGVPGGLYKYYKWKYPYGRSHNCSKILLMALSSYAADHEGAYPNERGMAESLAKLIPDYLDTPSILAGTSVSSVETANYYDSNKALTDDLCGWGFFPGLKKDSQHSQMLAWAKVPLDHNGGRNSPPAREVLYVGGHVAYVLESEWEKQFKNQKAAWEKQVQQEAGGSRGDHEH